MKKKELMLNLVSLIFVVVLLIVFIELFAFTVNKLFFPPKKYYEGMEFNYSSIENCPPDFRKWDPYTIASNVKNYNKGEHCNINSDGFRGPELKMEETYRVFIIGGSTVWGTGSSSENTTIPAQLQKMLDNLKTRTKFEVVNAGEVGYQSTQELIYFHRKILQYNPDMIIVFDGRNDIHVSHKGYYTPEINHDTILVLRKHLDTSLSSLFYHFQRVVLDISFFRHSSFLQLLRNLGTQKVEKSTYGIGKVNPIAADEYVKNIELIATIAKAKGIKSVFFFQPTLGCGNKPYSEYEKKIIQRIKDTSNWLEVLQVMMPLTEKKFLEMGKRNNITTISLADLFDNINGTIYVDSAHYTDEGNKLIAREMLKVIQKEAK